MKTATIYTKPMCPYCVRAMGLLQKRGVKFVEISAAFDVKLRDEMIKRSNGANTYPQIFIGEVHVGDCDALAALDEAGKLKDLLDA